MSGEIFSNTTKSCWEGIKSDCTSIVESDSWRNTIFKVLSIVPQFFLFALLFVVPDLLWYIKTKVVSLISSKKKSEIEGLKEKNSNLETKVEEFSKKLDALSQKVRELQQKAPVPLAGPESPNSTASLVTPEEHLPVSVEAERGGEKVAEILPEVKVNPLAENLPGFYAKLEPYLTVEGKPSIISQMMDGLVLGEAFKEDDKKQSVEGYNFTVGDGSKRKTKSFNFPVENEMVEACKAHILRSETVTGKIYPSENSVHFDTGLSFHVDLLSIRKSGRFSGYSKDLEFEVKIEALSVDKMGQLVFNLSKIEDGVEVKCTKIEKNGSRGETTAPSWGKDTMAVSMINSKLTDRAISIEEFPTIFRDAVLS